MKKKGFTLVELLSVIAILALLVIVAIPSITKMLRESKQKSFKNEVEIIKDELVGEVLDFSLSGENPPDVISSVGDYQLNLDGRELDYYAELNKDGTVKYLEITDGEFYYQHGEDSIDAGKVVDLQNRDQNVPSKIEFIKDNVAVEKIYVYDNVYNIYDETNSVPIIITNTTSNTIKANIYYENTLLGKEVIIPPGEEDFMFFVKLTREMINSMQEGKLYNLKIDTEINLGKNISDNNDVTAKHSYINKIKVQKVNSGVIIKNAESTLNNEKIAFNQSGIFVPRNVSVSKLKVNVYNTSNSQTYKFTNINRQELKINETNNINNKKYIDILIQGEELLRYQEYLRNGQYILSNKNYNFDMEFGSKPNIQKIFFDFEEYINPGVHHDSNITIASKENFTDTSFGDFEIQSSSVSQYYHKNEVCTYKECFGTSGKLENDNGKLVLGLNKGILALNISQSMSVRNTYSVYFTIDGTVNQTGKPDKNFPATIIAISEADTKYLSWIGFYNGYLQVYSYYNGQSRMGQRYNETVNGFASIPVSQYEGKIMNIQVTASKNGKTKVYINGDKIKEFNSGGHDVSYTIATIGDLRPSRGLKFTGRMYDLTLYNSELSEESVLYNWNHAKKTWNIN